MSQAEQVPTTSFAESKKARSLADERAHLHALRRRTEAALETLLRLLDELDGDPDLEPSLGQSCASPDLVDVELDESDDEPSLGAHEADDQHSWQAWHFGELEDDCEDEGAQCDDEGVADDNGIADVFGMVEQYGVHLYGGVQ